MKSNRTKKFILLALLAVLIIIWIKNLSVFENPTAYNLVKTSKVNKISKAVNQIGMIEYKEPKFNPFSIPEIAEPRKETVQNIKNNASSEIAKISGRYRIDGIVTEKDRPQAILRKGDQSCILVSIGDSLDGWRVDKILDEKIIFSYGRGRDTLHLKIK